MSRELRARIAMRADRMFERHFVVYGVRIGLCADSRALLDTLEHDPVRMHLPFGWRAVEDHEPDASVSVRYELLIGVWGGACRSYRLYAGTNLVADVRSLTDAGRALAAHAEPFVAEHATAIHGSGRCATSACLSASPTPDVRSTP
jgi:hypothetical protein